MLAPIKHLNQLIKLSRITINIQAGVCKLNSAEMFPPGAGLDTPGIDLKTILWRFWLLKIFWKYMFKNWHVVK